MSPGPGSDFKTPPKERLLSEALERGLGPRAGRAGRESFLFLILFFLGTHLEVREIKRCAGAPAERGREARCSGASSPGHAGLCQHGPSPSRR